MLKTVCSGKMSYQAPCGGFQEDGVENHENLKKLLFLQIVDVYKSAFLLKMFRLQVKTTFF